MGKPVKGNDTVNKDGKEVELQVEMFAILIADWEKSLRQSIFIQDDDDLSDEESSDYLVAITLDENEINFIFNDEHFIVEDDQLAMKPKASLPLNCWPYFDPMTQASLFEEQRAMAMAHINEMTSSSLSSDEDKPSTSGKKKRAKRGRGKVRKSKTKPSIRLEKTNEMPGPIKKPILPEHESKINSMQGE